MGAFFFASLVVLLTLDGCAERASEPAVITMLQAPNESAAMWPHLQRGPDGRVVMSWLEKQAEGRHALRFSTLEQDRWRPPVTIAEGEDWFVNWADFPSVTSAGEQLLAHWLVRSGSSPYAYDIAMAISDDGGRNWSDIGSPHDDKTTTEHGFVHVLPSEQGFDAVWLDGRNMVAAAHDHDEGAGQDPGMTLRYAHIGADGNRSDDALLDDRTCDCCQTTSVRSSAGLVVVYRDRLAGEIRDISRVILSDGKWSAPAPVARDGWVIAGCPVNGPAASASDNDVVVAWFSAVDDLPQLRLARSVNGGLDFSPPVVVAEGKGRVIGRVDVELAPNGDAIVSWLASGDAGAGFLRVVRVSAAGTVGESVAVAALDATRAGGFPRMIRNDDQLVFAWTATGGAQSELRSAIARISILVPPAGGR